MDICGCSSKLVVIIESQWCSRWMPRPRWFDLELRFGGRLVDTKKRAASVGAFELRGGNPGGVDCNGASVSEWQKVSGHLFDDGLRGRWGW